MNGGVTPLPKSASKFKYASGFGFFSSSSLASGVLPAGVDDLESLAWSREVKRKSKSREVSVRKRKKENVKKEQQEKQRQETAMPESTVPDPALSSSSSSAAAAPALPPSSSTKLKKANGGKCLA